MTLPLQVRSAAQDEIAHAVGRYDGERAGLGREFYDEVRRVLLLICENPEGFARVPRLAALDMRLAPLARFPYRIVFLHEPNLITIIALSHSAQRPRYWRGRLDEA